MVLQKKICRLLRVWVRAHAVAFTFFLPSWPSQRVGGGDCCVNANSVKTTKWAKKTVFFMNSYIKLNFVSKKNRRFAPNFFPIYDVRVAFFLGASRLFLHHFRNLRYLRSRTRKQGGLFESIYPDRSTKIRRKWILSQNFRTPAARF